jgi:drug/metabolite transporter (DMT)-like permease
VTVTSISTILIPLCCLLLTYSVWCLYKEKKDWKYKPFLLGLAGSILIVFDNFLFGELLQLRNIPSYIGNVSLIVASVWAAKDQSKDQASPFGF